jgi:hydrogenase expression/formation protein HypC
MRIVAIDGAIASIAIDGLEQRASLVLVPHARPGDYVLVHAGFAITVLEEAEAEETIALFTELAICSDESLGADDGDA